MNYPHKLYANVLLFDGKIINWKTGTTSWENNNWMSSRQPIRLVMDNEKDITSESFCVIVNSVEENNNFFNIGAVGFYKMFEIHDNYCKDIMFLPY